MGSDMECKIKKESKKKELEIAEELVKQSWNLMREGDDFAAIRLSRQALNIKVRHHGERAAECAFAYYSLGTAISSHYKKFINKESFHEKERPDFQSLKDNMDLALKLLNTANEIAQENKEANEKKDMETLQEALFSKGSGGRGVTNFTAKLRENVQILQCLLPLELSGCFPHLNATVDTYTTCMEKLSDSLRVDGEDGEKSTPPQD